MEFILAIYSCKKNLIEKSETLYQYLHNKIPNCKTYIVYGDKTISTEYQIKEDKYLILRCGDLYDDLSLKTIQLFKVMEMIYPNSKGLLKCDDDIIPNINKLKKIVKYVDINNISYFGNVNEIKDDFVTLWYKHRMTNPIYHKPLLVRGCKYCTGPIYYVNMNTIRIFNKIPIIKEIIKNPIDYIFEDNMVGYLLSKENITPTHSKIYYNNIQEYNLGCIQNIDNRIRNLYVFLQGGLGNQLFEVAAGFELAKNHNMHLVLVYFDNYKMHMSHNSSIDEFISTIFNSFNCIPINSIYNNNIITFEESKCFDYNQNIIRYSADYFIKGYYQNKKYLKNHKKEFLSILKNEKISNELMEKYLQLKDSYFIHIRRGDYVNHPVYEFDRETYLKNAISYILKNENKDVHFFIISNDIEFCKKYTLLDNLNKTFIENMDTLHSLYFMSLCNKGGICSNSTFSGWASMLNENPNKKIIVPKHWINIDYSYEIPFDYTVCL